MDRRKLRLPSMGSRHLKIRFFERRTSKSYWLGGTVQNLVTLNGIDWFDGDRKEYLSMDGLNSGWENLEKCSYLCCLSVVRFSVPQLGQSGGKRFDMR